MKNHWIPHWIPGPQSTQPPSPPTPRKKQFLTFLWFQGVISCRVKPKKFFFLVFLVEFQLYFTGFLKFYIIVLLLKTSLTSKTEKTFHMVCFFFFFLQFYEPPDLGKKIFRIWNVLKSEVYLTCINLVLVFLKVDLELFTFPKNQYFYLSFQTFKGTLKMLQVTFCP